MFFQLFHIKSNTFQRSMLWCIPESKSFIFFLHIITSRVSLIYGSQ